MQVDKYGKTVLHRAVTNNNLKDVDAILQHMESNLPSPYKDFVNIKTFVEPQTYQGGCSAIY